MTPADARETLVRALRLDLVGPDGSDERDASLREEVLRVRPARAYLTGFLVPAASRDADPAKANGAAEDEDLADETADEQLDSPSPEGDEAETPAAQRPAFPSSIGLSVLVYPEEKRLEAQVTCATYERILVASAPAPKEGEDGAAPDDPETHTRWKRHPHDFKVTIDLVADGKLHEHDVGLDGLVLSVVTRPFQEPGRSLLDDGTRAVTIFLVNRRDPTKPGGQDGATVFQAGLRVRATNGFLPRPNPRGTSATDPHDERVADLLYRDDGEHAIGHGISVVAQRTGNHRDVFVHEVATCWLPKAEVPRTVANEAIELVEFEMEKLAELPADDPEAVFRSLMPMVQAYRDWIDRQQAEAEATLRQIRNDGVRAARLETTRRILDEARKAAGRIERGIRVLMVDPLAYEAFRLANRAMASQMWQRDGERLRRDAAVPTWRPFQLAFVLLSLPGIVQPESEERETVDLIFFPTGGGKTEAYLGLAAFTLLLRRLRRPDASSGGVAVLMRYTLRLLTLDQLSRAATLVCALEVLRRKAPEKLGPVRFSIGLWVGRGATPNKFGSEHGNEEGTAIQRVLAYKGNRGPLPFPLERCPWCGTPFVNDSFEIKPNRTDPKQLRVLCFGKGCEFRWSKAHPHGLPVVIVDDEIYRELPPFLIATVDKLASLPWVFQTAFLFGHHVTHHHPEWGYYGGGEVPDALGAKALPAPLDPPDLVLQDELHLVSGPLGTMVGLYETAIGRLSERRRDGRTIRPKIVASTATVRRADAQIRGLFCREDVRVFPPPGPDRRTSFFAEERPPHDDPRWYLGVTAPGRSQKAMLMRSYTSLLAAAARIFREHPAAADPYMTLVGYFNSLRELGGSRRIVEDEVRARLGRAGLSRRENDERLFADRKKIRVVEITSRLTTDEVRTAYGELRLVHEPRTEVATKPREAKRGPRPVDVALATNMISVGLDVSRLGLMVVCGQPKTTAEYIQATSRVGRDPKRPGLVVTLLNGYRARDRSHLEHFPGYHTSFYRAVEATSVTPFAPRAIDRGLAAVTVSLARLLDRRLLQPNDAKRIAEARADLGFVADVIAARAEAHVEPEHALPAAVVADLRKRVEDLLDAWERVASDDPGAVGLAYQPYERNAKGRFLLHMPVDPALKSATADVRRFAANRSMRDVEGTTAVHVVDLPPLTAAPATAEESSP